MASRILKIFLISAVLGALASSCSVTRHIPEGSYMLKRNVIVTDKETPRKERITATELNRYVQQSTNKHFLGTNLNAWLYAQANPASTNSWNRMLRRMGEEPVVWSPARTRLSTEYIETYMASRGFFESKAWNEVDTLRRQKVVVKYGTLQGTPSRITSIRYDFRDKLLEGIIMQDSVQTLLHTDDIFDTGVLDAERQRIATNLKNRGYYNFDVSNITYVADSTRGNYQIDLTMILHRHLKEYLEDGTAVYEDNKIYRIRDVFVYPDYDMLADYSTSAYSDRLDTVSYNGLNIIYEDKLKIRPKILQKSIKFGPDYLYTARQVAATSAELMRLGAFRSASLLFTPVDLSEKVANVDGTTIAEDYLRCDIRLVPSLRQSYKVELEGSAASTFYGLRATLGYQNRNLLRGAELFDASLTAGFEFMTSGSRRVSYELGVGMGLTFPRFVNVWDMDKANKAKSPETRLTLSANWQDRAYYTRALLGLNWGWSWGLRRFENFTLRPVDIGLVRRIYIDPTFEEELHNPYLRASYNSQLIAGLSTSYVYNNQPRDLNAGAVVLRANLETTGNLFQGLTHWLSKPTTSGYYNILGVRFSQYVRGDVSFSQKIVLGAKTAIAYRLAGGAIYSYGNSQSPPIDKMFFAGGINSMRGWGVRTLGPGGMLYEKKDYPSQMGDVKLEGNLEFRFPVWSIFHGAVFCDIGNIWFMRSSPSEYPNEAVFHFNNFYKQLAFNTGLGLRLDIKFAVLRLDWGIQLHNPGLPAGERWIHNFKWADTALNFGVGYPF
jgi:outer membrane protein assembly factor BamA